MQVIVLGASRAGLTLVRRLISAGHDVVLLDSNAENIAGSFSFMELLQLVWQCVNQK
jgi:Trk K+ transport system NAD-binding subunit